VISVMMMLTKTGRPLALALLAASALAWPAAAAPTARQILEAELAVKIPRNYGAAYNITHTDSKNNAQSRKAVFFLGQSPDKPGMQRQLLYFLAPKDLYGNASLTENQMGWGKGYFSKSWMYSPLFGQVRLNSASNWRNRIFGSSMTVFDNLLQDIDWFEAALAGEDTLPGRPSYRLELAFKEDLVKSRSGYSRMIRWIDQESKLWTRIELFDLKGEKAKILERKLASVGGFWIPSAMKCTLLLADGKKETTSIEIGNPRLDMDLGYEDFFSKKTLEAGVPMGICQKVTGG
jgi:hypothetical protein